MLKLANVFEVVRSDRVYTLTLPSSAPLGELHDVLFELRSFVVDKLNEAIAADKPKAPKEEPKVE